MGAVYGVIHVKVSHRIVGTFYLVCAEVGHGHYHHVCFQRQKKYGPGGAESDAKASNSLVCLFQYGVDVARSNVADAPTMGERQAGDDGLKKPPRPGVLGIENDRFLIGRQSAKPEIGSPFTYKRADSHH